MKLLLCLNCYDVFSLDYEEKHCQCWSVKGKYIDQQDAIYSGEFAIPLGFANSSLIQALKNQPEEGIGESFTAFVIPKNCPTFIKVPNES